MSLWLDKHRPKKLNKLDFHKKQAEHLEALVKGKLNFSGSYWNLFSN